MEEVAQTQTQTSDVSMSKGIGKLASALAKTQSELDSVSKDEKGYGYNYASLASTIEVSKDILTKNGLAISQIVGSNDKGDPSVTTLLMHSESGEYISGKLTLPRVEMKSCNSAQEFGASVSYARRYALQAILNMASEDNDASSKGFDKPKKNKFNNAASGTSKKTSKRSKASDSTETKAEDKPAENANTEASEGGSSRKRFKRG